MNWDEMLSGLRDAENTIRVADSFIDRLARFLVGRLRKLSSDDTLGRLKKELSQYNSRTKEWKS